VPPPEIQAGFLPKEVSDIQHVAPEKSFRTLKKNAKDGKICKGNPESSRMMLDFGIKRPNLEPKVARIFLNMMQLPLTSLLRMQLPRKM
jgi:hypothetical protein